MQSKCLAVFRIAKPNKTSLTRIKIFQILQEMLFLVDHNRRRSINSLTIAEMGAINMSNDVHSGRVFLQDFLT